MTNKVLENLAQSWPKPCEMLGNCPPNPFMFTERPAMIIVNDKESTELPRQVYSEDGLSVWFKRDSIFEQPFLWSKVRIETTDLGYPANGRARAFCALWTKLFDDSQRETRYLA
jgi:hypothetical protein